VIIKCCLAAILACSVSLIYGGGAGAGHREIDSQLGRSGQKSGDVYRVGFPRTDLHVSVHGLAIKPGLALGSWPRFSETMKTPW